MGYLTTLPNCRGYLLPNKVAELLQKWNACEMKPSWTTEMPHPIIQKPKQRNHEVLAEWFGFYSWQ